MTGQGTSANSGTIAPNCARTFHRRAYHDLAGLSASPIPQGEHELQLQEKCIEALLVLLARRQILRLDENRRGLESLGDEVHSLSNAEFRVIAISNNLILKGIFSVEELATKLAQIDRRQEPLL